MVTNQHVRTCICAMQHMLICGQHNVCAHVYFSITAAWYFAVVWWTATLTLRRAHEWRLGIILIRNRGGLLASTSTEYQMQLESTLVAHINMIAFFIMFVRTHI